MAESKTAKLKRFEKTRSEIRIELATLATQHEMRKMDSTATMGRVLAARSPRYKNEQSNKFSQLVNLKKKDDLYTRKIDILRNELYR